jgi:CRP/FNR family transcriptional regulator, cyclic AMP receptor protein
VTTIALLDVDPDLADVVDVDDLPHARAALVARTIEVPSGPWNPTEYGNCVGLLVVDGAVLREVVAGDVAAMELLGPGDVIVPAADDTLGAFVDAAVCWTAVLDSRLALLSDTLVQRLSDWPGVLGLLVRRMAERSSRQSVMQAVCHHPRVDARLRGLFWHLADRWGRVTPGGVVLPLRLTHDLLARLVGAQRPTVSTALKSLQRAGEVTRRRDGAWVLLPESKARLEALRVRADDGRSALELIQFQNAEQRNTRAQLERLRHAWEEQSATLMTLRQRSTDLRAEARELAGSIRRFRGYGANGMGADEEPS